MTYSELVFGIAGVDLARARALVERVLGVALSLHDSMYRGGDYLRGVDANPAIG